MHYRGRPLAGLVAGTLLFRSGVRLPQIPTPGPFPGLAPDLHGFGFRDKGWLVSTLLGG